MTRLCRTFQTAPVAVPRENTAKYLESGLAAEGFRTPDWLVPDLEDGTAPNMRGEGLENVLELVPESAPEFPGEIWPRVEWGYDEPEARERGSDQIHAIAGEIGDHVAGVVVPKVGRLPDVERAAETVAEAESTAGLPDGSLGLAIIVESARAISDLRKIARLGEDGRLAALVFGPVDYTAELGGRTADGERPDWADVLSRISNEASANGLLAIGGPFDRLFVEHAGVSVYNAAGYAEQVQGEAAIGLDGSWSLHPNQTAQANRIHMPDGDELAADLERIEQFTEAKAEGTGAVTIDGQMIDEATAKTFATTVRTVRTIHERRPSQTEERYEEALLERALAVELPD